jgi:1-acyl-sn-glycerol-3-phosphate acyltransferase
MQGQARSLVEALEIRSDYRGSLPGPGLLVCNHLSYLDILVLGASQPVVFVAKSEVRGWPLFGWLAARGGTLFIRRQDRADVARLAGDIAARLKAGWTVVVFPEGTSSAGHRVLPFHSSLLEAAVEQQVPATPAAITYSLPGGSVADDVCYWRDMTFAGHFLRLLGLPAVEATVAYGLPRSPGGSRKALARSLHEDVRALAAGRREQEGLDRFIPSLSRPDPVLP